MMTKDLIIVLVVFVGFVSAIKMSVGAQKRCIVDSLWDKQTIRGRYKWVTKYEGKPEFTVFDAETRSVLVTSTQEEGTFAVDTENPEFCFSFSSSLFCNGWKQTADCNPHGTREPLNDKDCTANILQGFSGYCECKKKGDRPGTFVPDNKFFTCDHGPFTCQEICDDRGGSGAAVIFDFTVGKALSDLNDAATKEHAVTTDLLLDGAVETIKQTKETLDEASKEEEEHRNTSEWVNFFVVWSHIIPIFVFLALSILQGYLFFLTFKKNNII
eukprot:c14353_g1_i1.p1 GENE.c14353_g1_i1~~c14353_g1_i1.p1  ORF type:complete len:271 (-),score=104.70 c14353_g1_i1:70-882(-)